MQRDENATRRQQQYSIPVLSRNCNSSRHSDKMETAVGFEKPGTFTAQPSVRAKRVR